MWLFYYHSYFTADKIESTPWYIIAIEGQRLNLSINLFVYSKLLITVRYKCKDKRVGQKLKLKSLVRWEVLTKPSTFHLKKDRRKKRKTKSGYLWVQKLKNFTLYFFRISNRCIFNLKIQNTLKKIKTLYFCLLFHCL